jgi:predicted N-acetyltransferase YhbS
MSLAHAPSPPRLAAERPQDAPAVEQVILRAFGPGRFAKAAERLREGRQPLRDLSVVAWDGDRIIGCVRLWPVSIAGTPAVLLGPIAVEATARSQGLGAALVEHACNAAGDAGHRLIVLVGDKPFFGPLGFDVTPRVAMPGPVDRQRVMLRALAPGADVGVEGLVAAA